MPVPWLINQLVALLLPLYILQASANYNTHRYRLNQVSLIRSSSPLHPWTHYYARVRLPIVGRLRSQCVRNAYMPYRFFRGTDQLSLDYIVSGRTKHAPRAGARRTLKNIRSCGIQGGRVLRLVIVVLSFVSLCRPVPCRWEWIARNRDSRKNRQVQIHELCAYPYSENNSANK